MKVSVQRVWDLCRGEPEELIRMFSRDRRPFLFLLAVTVLGAGLYGATIGLWRSPLQALFTAIKFPLLMILTTVANALLNGMLAQLLGLRISFRQSMLAIAASFAIASVVLASLSPVTLFMLMNTPPLGAGHNVAAHSFNMLSHVCLIGFAGIVGNAALYRLLAHLCGNRGLATRIMVAWLAGNLFLGCQLSWVMRPFIGAPHLPVEFLRAEAFQGNFYETVLRSLMHLV